MEHTPRPQRRRADHGFTMVEVLAVVIVLGILSAIAVPKYLEHRTKSRVVAVVSDARNLGAIIEDAWAKDRVYPAAPLNLGDINAKLSPDNRVAQYAVTGTGFTLCVIYVEGATSRAYARYESATGGVVAKGTGDGGAQCVDTPTQTTNVPPSSPPPTPPSGGDGGGGGGGDGGGSTSSLAAPSNLRVDAVPGEARATINWDGVTEATGYEVFLDGSTTPAWAGTDVTTLLTGLSIGTHEVAIRAVKDSNKSDLSTGVPFTIYGDNDFLVNAHPLEVSGFNHTWRSYDYTNTAATTESGESASNASRGRWWKYAATISGTVRVTAIAPTTGTMFSSPAVQVWRSGSTSVTTVQASTNMGGGPNSTAVSFPVVAGQTYSIRVASTYGNVGGFRVMTESGPPNDNVANATAVTGIGLDAEWVSGDQTNALAGTEAGENASNASRGMWWTYTATTSGTVRAAAIAPTTGAMFPSPAVQVWRSDATDITTVQASVSMGGGPNSTAVSFAAVAGQTFKIRVASTYGDPGGFQMLLNTSPSNDNVAGASEVAGFSDDRWTSADQTNALAGTEAGENASNASRGMWWTYTATTSRTVRVTAIAPTTGTMFPSPAVQVWRSNATSVTTVQASTNMGGGPNTTAVSFPVASGQTFKIRVASTYGSAGAYRVQVDLGPANDNLASATDISWSGGVDWTSVDQTNALAGTEAGENASNASRGMWWTYTATTSGTVRVTAIAPTTGTMFPSPAVQVWRSDATDITTVQASVSMGGGPNSTAVSFAAVAGQTFKIRVASTYNDPGGFRVRFGAN